MQVINMYGQSVQHIKYVLDNLIGDLKTPFVNNPYTDVICFENGVVNLRTGKLTGPAPPDMLITQCVPQEYKPDVDTTEVTRLMQTFFPEQCYPGESKGMLNFYRRWCGYGITGETSLQKALFVVGRGANGKSVLGAISREVWGSEVCKAVDSCHFQQGIGANNDNVFQVAAAYSWVTLLSLCGHTVVTLWAHRMRAPLCGRRGRSGSSYSPKTPTTRR